MEISNYMEFREVENAACTDANVEIYFLGMKVHTIQNAWTRPGGAVYSEKERCVWRAQRAVKRIWDELGEI